MANVGGGRDDTSVKERIGHEDSIVPASLLGAPHKRRQHVGSRWRVGCRVDGPIMACRLVGATARQQPWSASPWHYHTQL